MPLAKEYHNAITQLQSEYVGVPSVTLAQESLMRKKLNVIQHSNGNLPKKKSFLITTDNLGLNKKENVFPYKR